jgi:uncharacterized protein (DUF2252 family)
MRSAATRAAAVEAGRALRTSVPRRSQAQWPGTASRTDPLETLSSEFQTLLPSLVPVRLTRMTTSPFGYFRGAAAVMAADLVSLPTSGIEIQVCGDAHLANFGIFATPERSLAFDINDFDETALGSWEWDVKRFTSSVVLAAREAEHSDQQVRAAARASGRSYVDEIRHHAEVSVLESWYDRLDADAIAASIRKADRRLARRTVEQARTHTSLDLFPKLTVVGDAGARQIADRPPLISHVDETHRDAIAAIERSYRTSLPPERRILLDRFRLVDVARKVVGVGSVGTRCYVALLLDDVEAPLFLQIKEARQSVWTRVHHGPTELTNHGKGVVTGQRVMQTAPDVFLGWTSDGNRDFYVRQLADMKWAPHLANLSPSRFSNYASLCARALARGHARSGRAAEMVGYLGTSERFADAMMTFALAYAHQTERDYRCLVEAVNDGHFA